MDTRGERLTLEYRALEAGNFAFAPAQLTIPATTATPIEVRNTSDLPHTFMIGKPGVTVEAPPGETRPVTGTAPPGTYTSVCTYHPDLRTGTLVAE